MLPVREGEREMSAPCGQVRLQRCSGFSATDTLICSAARSDSASGSAGVVGRVGRYLESDVGPDEPGAARGAVLHQLGSVVAVVRVESFGALTVVRLFSCGHGDCGLLLGGD